MVLILGSAHLFEPLHYCYSHTGVHECGVVFVLCSAIRNLKYAWSILRNLSENGLYLQILSVDVMCALTPCKAVEH